MRNSYNIGNASYASAFGKASTINGQKKNIGAIGEPLPGTDAVAKARSFVTSRSPLLAFSEADGRVVFTRSFSLSDSPRGWDVSLDTDLNGKLFATSGASGNPTAEVIYDVAVKDAHSSRVLLESKYKDKVDTTGLTHVTGTNPDHVSTRLSDGDYTLFGEFDTFVRVEVTSSNFFGTPEQASALYFDSLTVKLDATPVPVPETTNLVGAFAVVGFGGYVWFRRRRTARCS